MQYIAFDSHKYYTLASVEPAEGGPPREVRIAHERGSVKRFLETCEKGSPVAVETIGNWYWIVDEIEAAGMVPRLVHARKAKLMFGCINKTDKLDARGLNRLQRVGTIPTVWIPPAQIRDARELPRTRMVVVRQRTQIKNRIQAMLAKYGLGAQGDGDIFALCRGELLKERVAKLPPQAAWAMEQLLEGFRFIEQKVKLFEGRTREVIKESQEIQLVMTMPGIGFILGTVIAFEVGDVARFASGSHLASYAGTVPRVHSSGDKTRYGRVRDDVNRYLKWAFVEGANTVAVHRRHWPDRHVTKVYERLKLQKGHQKAIGAVARHLAEATFWILKKKEPYFEPKTMKVLSKGKVEREPVISP